jgi:hypothetical protein
MRKRSFQNLCGCVLRYKTQTSAFEGKRGQFYGLLGHLSNFFLMYLVFLYVLNFLQL